jgi:hypothetical protein
LELDCTRTVHEWVVFSLLGLAFERKQIPQVIETIESRSKRMECLEGGGVLAKQVLSQLSYTPFVCFIQLTSMPLATAFRLGLRCDFFGTFGTTSTGNEKP